MTSIPSSRSDSAQRRSFLRRHRRAKLFQGLWRTLVLFGLFGGLIWGTTRPIWVLRQPNQVVVLGNHLLSAKAIRSLLPLSYPQSLLKIEPAAIARQLEAQPAIADAIVTRQLFPPGITIQVKERVPVALTLSKNALSPQEIPNARIASGQRLASSPLTGASRGLLDENGAWMPLLSYTSLSNSRELPRLIVFGSPSQYRSYWTQLYQAAIHSPIKILEIDCQDQANLILKTELGIVYLGPYSTQLSQQMNLLAQMRKISAKLDISQIAYIDLRSSKSPSIQMKLSTTPAKPNSLPVQTKLDNKGLVRQP